MEELEYTIEQNKRMLELELDKVAQYVANLKNALENEQISNITDWTDGYAARDVAKVSSLLAKHQGLSEALRIISK